MRAPRPTKAPAQKRYRPSTATLRGAVVGYLYALGLSAPDIAKRLGEGIRPATIRSIISRAKLPGIGQYRVSVPVQMQVTERDKLQKKANELGISINTLLFRMIDSGLLQEDLYHAITDGRYGSDEV